MERDTPGVVDVISFIARQKQETLAKSLYAKKKIYLDMNYWIDFLKYLNGLNTRKHIPELYELIIVLLEKDLIVIPVGDIHIMELRKNMDINKYKTMLELMENLSKNICFVCMDERLEHELLFCLRYFFNIKDAHSLLINELWTKPIFMEGTRFPVFEDDNPLKKTELGIQNSFLDYAWNKTLREIHILMDEEKLKTLCPKDYEKELTAVLIRGREENKDDYSSFKELFRKELWGTIDLSFAVINELLTNYFAGYEIGSSKIADSLYGIGEKKRIFYLLDLIMKSIIETKMYKILPAISISSGLHSLKRWEINSRYKESDAFDIMHAQIALPYCDYFLTEHNLNGLIKDKHLRFNEVFDCKIISSSEEAYKTLELLTLPHSVAVLPPFED